MTAIRRAAVQDAAAIARVHVASWQTTYPGMVPQRVLDRLSAERRREMWASRLAEPAETRTWVAELDGAIVGFVGTTIRDEHGRPRTGELESIYLLANARGQGIGTQLMDAALRDLAERQVESVTLWVLTANAVARSFYEQAGWRATGETNLLDFDGTPVEELRYELSLKS
jgi:ribosomal protein S18 acetylase RimI-like enzyme